MTISQTTPISVETLLNKAAHLLAEIAALPKTATPDKYEKRAKAIGEMYKTANLMETYAANYQNSAPDSLDYDTTYAATPQQEANLREELLGYYERIHGRSGEDGESADLSARERSSYDVLPDVGADGEA